MKNKLFSSLVLIALCVNTVLVSGFNPAPLAAKPAAPEIGGCPMFPADNFWNVPINHLPVHPNSAAWINSIGASEGFHMDFGSGEWDGGPIGIPYNTALNADFYNFDFYYPSESDPGPYPIPNPYKREHGSDHHILVVETSQCKLYEIYDASFDGVNWNGGSGAIWDLNSNAMRPDGWTSADAAGLPITPGLALYNEVASGIIEHALRFTANCTANYYIWPARHKAQNSSCSTPVPFGARFRLKADYNISGFSPQAQVLLQAFKTYGIVLADNGSDWYVSGEPNNNWDNDQLHELDVLNGSDFEAVDTSGLMVSQNSAQTNHSEIPHVYSVKRLGSNPTSSSSVQFSVYFSEPVSGVDASDFAVVTGGDIAGATVSNVSGSGVAYTVTVTVASGYGTIQLNVLDDDTITDGVNNLSAGFTNGETYTRIQSNTITLLSSGAYDGWILEYSEGSNTGGSLNKNGTALNLGDDGNDRQYRAILSFNTGGIPDGAQILSAKILIKLSGKTGTLPFGTHGSLLADIRKPAFGAAGLELKDFKTSANKSSAAIFGSTPAGGWYSADITAASLQFINKGGNTQLRLRFTKDDNNDNGADIAKFYSGNAGATSRPQLIVEYYMP